MQKSLTRLFMAVLMAALLASASIMSVSAADPCTHSSEQVIAGDTVTLESGTYILNEAISAGGKITVTGEVALCLNDQDLTAPSGVTGSFITVSNGATLTICGGTGGEGKIQAAEGTTDLRGIEVVSGGTLILESGTISGFTTTGDGGGVYVNGGIFTMDGGTIYGNTSATRGGGICNNKGNLTINSGAVIEKNSVTGTGTTSNYYGGGGVYAYTTGHVTAINGGTIKDNTAEKAFGGGVVVRNTNSVIDGAIISGNKAKDGGGVYGGAKVTLNNVTLNQNVASANGGGAQLSGTNSLLTGTNMISGNSAAYGGGLYIFRTATINSGTTISGNRATNGGGLYIYRTATINDGTTIQSNEATTAGGGVYFYGIENSATNYSTISGGLVDDNNALYGAGVMAYGTGANNTYLTISGGTISNNDATQPATSNNSGGGLAIFGSSVVTMTNGIIEKNTTMSKTGGGVYCGGSATFKMSGGTIAGDNESKSTGNGEGIGTQGRTELSGNAVVSGEMYIYGAKTHTISGNVSFTGEIVKADGVSATITISGGKFANDPTDFLAEGYTVKDINEGVLNYEVVKAKVPMTEVDACPDCGKGLGITEETLAELELLETGTYVLTESLAATNKLSVDGNVTLCLNNNTLTAPAGVTGSFITVNAGATLTICGGGENGAIQAAAATTNLRGIEVKSGGELILKSGTISGFITTGNGGGVMLAGATFTMNGGEISGNTAEKNGAGVFFNGESTFTMNNGTIKNNTSNATSNGGGGVSALGTSTFTMYGGTISGNTAASADYNGDGVYAGGSAKINVYGGIIQNNGEYGVSAMGNITLSGDEVEIWDNIETFALLKTIGITITSGSYAGTIDYGTRGDGRPVIGTIAISGGTFSGMEKADLIDWLATDAPYVVNGESEYTVTEGFADGGATIEFGSALNVNLNLAGDNGVTLADVYEDFNVTVSGGKSAEVETINIYPVGGGEATALEVVAIKGIAAKDIHDVFTVTVTKGGVEYYNEVLSVYEVVKALYDATTDKSSNYAKMLVDVVDYGIEAQKAFIEGSVGGARVAEDAVGSTAPSVDDAISGEFSGVAPEDVAVSLNLKDRVELNIYINGTISDPTSTEDFAVDTNYQGKGIAKICFHNIDAKDYDKQMSVNFTMGEESCSVTFSIKDYIVIALQNDSQTDLITAVYKYVKSVKTCVGQ